MAETQEPIEPVTGLHLWEIGDIITVNKLNAIVTKIGENKTAIDGNITTSTEHTSRLTAVENQTAGISHTDSLTTIDNNVKINGNLNLTSAANSLVTITQQVDNTSINLLQVTPSAMTLAIPTIITGKVTINNPAQFDSNDLVTKKAAQDLINSSIGQLNVESISCTGLETIETISETNGIIHASKHTIPFATTDNNGGYMSQAQVAALNASAQTVSYTPVTMNAAGNVVTSNTTTSAANHEIALGNVVTSLANVASKAEVNVLSKDINGDYTNADPAKHIVGLKDIIWGREATSDTRAIVGIIEDINKLSPLENLPTTVGRYVLEITMDGNNNPVVSWVPLENDGGEST